MEGIIVIFLVIGLYFLPTLNAMMSKKRDTQAIFLLNLFLGWTLIGWIVALVWSAKKD